MIEKFEFTGRDLAAVTASKVVDLLIANQHRCYHCDPADDLTTSPAGNTRWEESTVYVCRLGESWMNAAYVMSVNGSGFQRVTIHGGELFVAQDKTSDGMFYEFYRAPVDL